MKQSIYKCIKATVNGEERGKTGRGEDGVDMGVIADINAAKFIFNVLTQVINMLSVSFKSSVIKFKCKFH